MAFPTLNYEIDLWNKGFSVIGIDEVGRGAFAGPLTIGGVIFNNKCNSQEITRLLKIGINDSKKLSKIKRQFLYKIIQDKALFTATIFTPVEKINEIGIGRATTEAMNLVVKKLLSKISSQNVFVLTDAFKIPDLCCGEENQLPIIRGDQLSLSIAAASIIAKVERDQYMHDLASKYPEYGFEKHVGYGTKYHRDAILQYGPTQIHRKDFLRKLLNSAPVV